MTVLHWTRPGTAYLQWSSK